MGSRGRGRGGGGGGVATPFIEGGGGDGVQQYTYWGGGVATTWGAEEGAMHQVGWKGGGGGNQLNIQRMGVGGL